MPTAITQGFVLTREWRETQSGQDFVFWVSTSKGPVRVVISEQPSVFFLSADEALRAERVLGERLSWEHKPVGLKNFASQPVHACYFRVQKDLVTARNRLQQVGIWPLEADLRPTDRYLMERFIKGSVQIEGEPVAQGRFAEYLNPRLKPVQCEPSLKVVSLDIETSYTSHELYSIGISGGALKQVFMVGEGEAAEDWLHYFADEKALIAHFLNWFAELDPDVIIGWNVVGFDLQFLQQRCDALNIPFTLGRDSSPVSWRTSGQRQRRQFALVPGRVVMDGIEMLRTATWHFESFSLEFVARTLLGKGKLVHDVDSRAEEIQQMFLHEKDRLAEYNLEDCVLVEEIFAETDLMAFATERSRLTGLELDRPGGSVAAFDYLYLPALHRAGFVAPVVTDETGAGSPGGYVLDSRPGLYEHIIILDFKSLYPSIIRTFHVDPLAMVVGGSEDDAIPGFREAAFSRDRHLLPGIIESLWQARDKAKAAGQKAMSQAIKIIMNSFYGVLGTPGCRFFDPALVSSITLRGHEILRSTRDLLEGWGYPVIYGDTDSVFVHLQRPADVADADHAGRELMSRLNEWWRNHLWDSYRLVSCLEVEYETHFDRFLMPTVRGSDAGSKKRYAGMTVVNGRPQLTFKGLETVRSDWSPLARHFQQVLYEKVFTDQPCEDYVTDVIEKVRSGQLDEELVLRKRLRRKLDEYQKNVPPHARAARLCDEIRQARGLEPLFSNGGWVEYVMTIAGPEPKLYSTSPLDYQFYIERQIAPVADAILAFRHTSVSRLTDKQMGLF